MAAGLSGDYARPTGRGDGDGRRVAPVLGEQGCAVGSPATPTYPRRVDSITEPTIPTKTSWLRRTLKRVLRTSGTMLLKEVIEWFLS